MHFPYANSPEGSYKALARFESQNSPTTNALVCTYCRKRRTRRRYSRRLHSYKSDYSGSRVKRAPWAPLPVGTPENLRLCTRQQRHTKLEGWI